ncbi:hypothetical protein WA026_012615 [Henosepilachna vigintioctopunctata]|uniref:MADF domain-containing protein n=1 Tax=Henosepilachna vigintioctopunctata TaxID=420089 RepID=A0AAW1U8S0_9CUCU
MDSLLAYYRRERQKTLSTKSASGADCTYNSKWYAFKSIHFLMDKYKPRKTIDLDSNQNKKLANEQDNERDEQEAAEVDPNLDTQLDSTSHSQPSTSQQSGHTTVPPKKI